MCAYFTRLVDVFLKMYERVKRKSIYCSYSKYTVRLSWCVFYSWISGCNFVSIKYIRYVFVQFWDKYIQLRKYVGWNSRGFWTKYRNFDELLSTQITKSDTAPQLYCICWYDNFNLHSRCSKHEPQPQVQLFAVH